MRTFAYALLVALVAVASANDVTAPNLALRGGSAKPPVAGAAAVRATAPATQASTIRAVAPPVRSGSSLAEEASKLGKVAVTFEVTVPHIRTANSPPCKVVIVGNSKELGEWEVNKGISLITTAETYPIFTGIAFVSPNSKVEYKYAVVAQGGDTQVKSQWEANNRELDCGKVGAVLQRDEFVENRETDPRITDEPFQLTAQEWARYIKHHTAPRQSKA